MNTKLLASIGALAMVGAPAALRISSAIGPFSTVGVVGIVEASTGEDQARAASPAVSNAAGRESGGTARRTPWGDPDLQGTWTSEAELSVPFERATEFGNRQLLTDAEFAQRQSQVQKQRQTDNEDFDLETADRSTAGQVGSATSPPPHWLERGKTSRRTSMVIDPPDGRVPPTTPEAQRRLAASPRGSITNGPFSGPEELALWDRCITRGLPNVIFPTVYNANARIVQGPGYVAISYEMIHDTRIIPLDRQPHLSPAIRPYFGDSRGRWEGDTLVVDVTNFSSKTNYRGSGDTLHLIERFRRVDENTLRYEATVDDPQTWTKPWTASLELKPQSQGMFEYACHEGNYAMRNMLTASRTAEKAAPGGSTGGK